MPVRQHAAPLRFVTDKSRLTALVMLGIKDQETFPLIFYRDNCADMALTPDDISEEYIASSRALACCVSAAPTAAR